MIDVVIVSTLKDSNQNLPRPRQKGAASKRSPVRKRPKESPRTISFFFSFFNPNEVNRTVKFIGVILLFWKIVSNKDIKGDKRHRDPLKKPISSSDDSNLKILLEIDTMVEKMRGKHGNSIKSLTRDTSLALEHTCNGLIELSESLLLSGQQYVLLGEFRTDYLEATFS